MIWPRLPEYYQWLLPTDASKFYFHWTFLYIRKYFLKSYFKIQPPKSASCYLAFIQPFQSPWSSLAPIRNPQCLHYQNYSLIPGFTAISTTKEKQLESSRWYRKVSLPCFDIVTPWHNTQNCARADLAEPAERFSFFLARTWSYLIEFTYASSLVNLGFYSSSLHLFFLLTLPSFHPFNSSVGSSLPSSSVPSPWTHPVFLSDVQLHLRRPPCMCPREIRFAVVKCTW